MSAIHELSGFMPVPILRSVLPDQIGRILSTPQDDRRPKHVPVFVDNLWEWSRREPFPSRRSSAFGSPTAELARRFGPPDGIVCRVLLAHPFRIAQLRGCPDARYHPDVERLDSLIPRLVGTRSSIRALLDTPLASREQIDHGIRPLEPSAVRRLRQATSFWTTITLAVDDAALPVDPSAELFFTTGGGYALLPLDSR